jgi:hypothetical protein
MILALFRAFRSTESRLWKAGRCGRMDPPGARPRTRTAAVVSRESRAKRRVARRTWGEPGKPAELMPRLLDQTSDIP